MDIRANVFVCGTGAVSPAGWGMPALRAALSRGEPIPMHDLPRPGWQQPLRVRTVPPASPRPSFLAHPRLRRTSPIAHYAVAAALEALGTSAASPGAPREDRLGVVSCVMSGCVKYSRRFYDETLKDPATASPLVFPETVFNAPASHLGALLGATVDNYTLVGDPAIFLQGVALAADWLLSDRVDGCLVIGAEEMDWLTTDAFRLFHRKIILGEGAAALYLKCSPPASAVCVRLDAITQPHLFCKDRTRADAIQRARAELGDGRPDELLCDGVQGVHRLDRDEMQGWQGWQGPRLSPKLVLGDGRMAAAAWQCAAAIDMLQQQQYPAASISIAGCNQQAIAGRFVKHE